MSKTGAKVGELCAELCIGSAYALRPVDPTEKTLRPTPVEGSREGTFTADAQAVASIARITGGNFRLLHRLFVQIGRILRINDLSVITDRVVEAARSTLVIGAT